MRVFVIPRLEGQVLAAVFAREMNKIISHNFTRNTSGRGLMFIITFIADEQLSNNLLNSEPALIFLLEFLIC